MLHYVRTMRPSQSLIDLVVFILQAYGKACFDIWRYPQLENGAFHLFNYIQLCKEHCSKHWEFLSGHFVRNSYFFNPENLLYCGVFSTKFSTNEIRDQCAAKLLKARVNRKKRKSKSKKVRKCKRPKKDEINFEATNLFDVLKWDKQSLKLKIRDPPLTDLLSPAEIKLIVQLLNSNQDLPDEIKCKIYKLLCHSQHCERCVKQTTKSLLTNSNHDDQKSHIIVTEKSRERNPCTFTKESFKQSLNFDDNQK